MRAVIYTRVSTDEQSPKSQLQEVFKYAYEKGYDVVEVYEESISGVVDPLNRPIFKKLLDFVINNNIEVIVIYDLTRFYRAKSPIEALSKLRSIIESYNILIDFAREPQIEDPLLQELWMFIKSWFATYERLQASIRTKYGMMRVKKEGKLYHKPSILHYYAAWLFNKELNKVTRKDLSIAETRLKPIIKKYWDDPNMKNIKIGEILSQNELKDMYIKYPKAPRSYVTFYRLLNK